MTNSPTAIILVGGLGTRLRALYPDRPKALVPVSGRPFMAWMLDWLRAHGIARAHLAAGHLAGMIVNWINEQNNPLLTASQEPKPLGTGGGLLYALQHVADAELLVLNGDSFLPNLDLCDWLAQPLAPDVAGELAITRIEAPGRYGTVEFDAQHTITAFLEKADRPAGWVNGGVYRLRRSALAPWPADTAVSLETEVFPALAKTGALRAHQTPQPLLDMGTPEGIENMTRWLNEHPDFFQRL